MRILGIDYGKKRIGLAISDESLTIAKPIDPIIYEEDEYALSQIQEAIQEHEVDTIVIGLPVSLSGEEEMQARVVKEFAAKVGDKAQKKIEYVDERLSTSQARVMLDKSQKNFSIDSQAAQIILQTYLDTNKNKTNGKS